MNLFDPGLAPFTLALAAMALILLCELASALFGASAADLLDNALPDFVAKTTEAGKPGVGPGLISRVLSWLHVGRAPLLILVAAFLTSFGLTGFFLQSIVQGLGGFHLWSWLAAIPALAVAAPFTHMVGRFSTRATPEAGKPDESDATSRREEASPAENGVEASKPPQIDR